MDKVVHSPDSSVSYLQRSTPTMSGVSHRFIFKIHVCKIFEHKKVNIFLPISFNICFGCSKELSQLSTHNICFALEIRKLFFVTHS